MIMQTFKVLIEISKGTVNNKYEYDEKSGEFKLDFVFENLVWPFNYGEVVDTLAGDGDALDAIVLSTNPIGQGKTAECKVIGLIKMLDRGQQDDKLLFVPVDDPLSSVLNDISDISEEQKEEWKKLYAKIARQKKKIIVIQGFLGKHKALNEIKNSKI